jgi:hypothetical protein
MVALTSSSKCFVFTLGDFINALSGFGGWLLCVQQFILPSSWLWCFWLFWWPTNWERFALQE